MTVPIWGLEAVQRRPGVVEAVPVGGAATAHHHQVLIHQPHLTWQHFTHIGYFKPSDALWRLTKIIIAVYVVHHSLNKES
jgi:hypothetical protein